MFHGLLFRETRKITASMYTTRRSNARNMDDAGIFHSRACARTVLGSFTDCARRRSSHGFLPSEKRPCGVATLRSKSGCLNAIYGL